MNKRMERIQKQEKMISTKIARKRERVGCTYKDKTVYDTVYNTVCPAVCDTVYVTVCPAVCVALCIAFSNMYEPSSLLHCVSRGVCCVVYRVF